MVKIQQTYLIGLGRQGRATLAHLKKRMAETRGDLPAVKLLAIDVIAPGDTAADQGEDCGLGPTEEIVLPLDAALADFKTAQRLHPWLPGQLAGLGDGWTRTRAAARLAWHANLKALLPFLIAHLNEIGSVATRDTMAARGFDVSTDRTEANVIVIGSLGDTTASGLLVDVTYLFHHLYRSTGLQTASTGLLFLPPATDADAATEARVYAALKEINAGMAGNRLYRCEYRSEGAAHLVVESEAPLFNRGCYLIDTRNEKTLTLKDEGEAAQLAGEWLFQTLLTPLKARIDEFASTQGAIPWVQGQLAAYNSLGFASYVLPAEALRAASASRLAEALITEQMLKPELFARVADRLASFTSLARLKPDDLLGEELRRDKDGRPFKLQSDLIARLKSLPRDQIVASVQATMTSIGRDVLPGLKTQIDSNARRVVHDAEESLDQEVAALLRNAPSGALSLATQLVSRLRDDAARYSQSLKRRETALLARNQQLVNVLARQGALLKNAVASVPPAGLVIAAASAGILAPLILATAWLWQGLESAPAVRLALIAGCWLLGLGAAGYTFWQTNHGVERIRDQFANYLQNRFETELSLSLAQSAHRLYDAIGLAADARLERLNSFADRLHRLAAAFHADADTARLTGNIGFTLQRSVLSPESIAALYQRYANQPDTEAHLYSLIEKHGTLDQWIGLAEGDLRARLLDYGQALFEPMRELRVNLVRGDAPMAAMAGAPTDGASIDSAPALPGQAEPDRLARDLCDKAAPLCTFNVYHSGQAPVSTVQLFIGLESPSLGVVKSLFEQVDPTTVFEPTGDRHSLIATAIRRGMPLFGLLRLADFRLSYFTALGRRDAIGAQHVDDDAALAPDLNPLTTAMLGPTLPDPGLVFALAAAFGDITPGEDGVFAARDDPGAPIPLAPQRLASAVLLGADDRLLQRLDAAVQRRAGSQPSAETIAELTAYTRRAALDAWERRRIDGYIRALRS